MKRRMSYVWIVVASVVMMLHNMLPHQHDLPYQQNIYSISAESATDVGDFLQWMFHLDQGEDHLENFEKNSSSSFVFQVLKCESPQIPVIQDIQNVCFVPRDITISSEFFLRQQSFRGPPEVS